ncbi:hypothetical protein IFM89_005617 [Coptis chinensis]|uniref:Uncharacterized protein n=1 Tax=Coptis chinensis TaxID=261450 RepID=A0A835HR71_9MAGN|nr:hypothetical protein IFM89_005617 [Coptis chinensis]
MVLAKGNPVGEGESIGILESVEIAIEKGWLNVWVESNHDSCGLRLHFQFNVVADEIEMAELHEETTFLLPLSHMEGREYRAGCHSQKSLKPRKDRLIVCNEKPHGFINGRCLIKPFL